MTAATRTGSEPRAAEPLASTALWIVAGAASAVMAWLTISNPWPYGSDDSLFYLVVATRLGDGDGVAFNELMATNGVQPLRQAIVGGVTDLGRAIGVAILLGQVRGLVVIR